MSPDSTDPDRPTPAEVDPDAAGGSTRPLHLRGEAIAAVAAGGFLGTLARYGAGVAVPAGPGGWPWATFTVNIVGAFALSALLAALGRLGPDVGARRTIRLAFGTGLLGSFTTYSSLAVEQVHLAGFDALGLSVVYGVGTVLAGLAGAALGFVAGRWVTPEAAS